MWKEAPRTRKKEVLSGHLVESSRPSLTTVNLEVQRYEYLEPVQPLTSFCNPSIETNSPYRP